jgi:hypothetical protein
LAASPTPNFPEPTSSGWEEWITGGLGYRRGPRTSRKLAPEDLRRRPTCQSTIGGNPDLLQIDPSDLNPILSPAISPSARVKAGCGCGREPNRLRRWSQVLFRGFYEVVRNGAASSQDDRPATDRLPSGRHRIVSTARSATQRACAFGPRTTPSSQVQPGVPAATPGVSTDSTPDRQTQRQRPVTEHLGGRRASRRMPRTRDSRSMGRQPGTRVRVANKTRIVVG